MVDDMLKTEIVISASDDEGRFVEVFYKGKKVEGITYMKIEVVTDILLGGD